jgi:hypothetical protein
MDSSGPQGDCYDDVMMRVRAARAALDRAATSLAALATSRNGNTTEPLERLRTELDAGFACDTYRSEPST